MTNPELKALIKRASPVAKAFLGVMRNYAYEEDSRVIHLGATIAVVSWACAENMNRDDYLALIRDMWPGENGTIGDSIPD